jgi:hypothetical protein
VCQDFDEKEGEGGEKETEAKRKSGKEVEERGEKVE